MKLAPHFGIFNNLYTIIIHALPKFLVILLPDFKLEQEIDKFNVILIHGPVNIITGLFLHGNLEQAQLDIGLDTLFYNIHAN